ncbi:MAG: imidazole glycerol phosphate synthase subunit HisH [Pseudomonadota bacterium]
MITVIDYGMGNLESVANMLKKIGVPARVSSCPADLLTSSKIVLPGVGSFDHGIKKLEKSGFLPTLDEAVVRKEIPILGICLGMQLLTEQSEEGTCSGLGWIKGRTIKFPGDSGFRVPHMGWNRVRLSRPTPLTDNLSDDRTRFYFVHSFYVACESVEDCIMTTKYGLDFTSAVQRKNVVGVQFHPEKSHRFGMQLLRNFCDWVP